MTPPRFSDFANEDVVLDGAKVPIDSILNTAQPLNTQQKTEE